MTDYKQLCVELLDSAQELDDLIEGIRLGDYTPDSFTLQPMRAVLDRARAALAEPEPEGPNNEPQIGDYVLATKWSDGDPCDHFCVGFFAGKDRDRYKVVDSDGNLFRGNGFRRCETITQKEGESILSLKIGDKPGPSVWWHLERIRGIEVQPEPEKPTDEDLWDIGERHLWTGTDESTIAYDRILTSFITAARAVLARWGK